MQKSSAKSVMVVLKGQPVSVSYRSHKIGRYTCQKSEFCLTVKALQKNFSKTVIIKIPIRTVEYPYVSNAQDRLFCSSNTLERHFCTPDSLPI